MGEAKRRKNLGIQPREKNEDIKLPELEKKPYKKMLGLHYIDIQLSHFFFMVL